MFLEYLMVVFGDYKSDLPRRLKDSVNRIIFIICYNPETTDIKKKQRMH